MSYPTASSEEVRLDLTAVPSLPGFSPFDYKDRYHKSQIWGISNKQCVENTGDKRQKFVTVPRPKDPWRDGYTLPRSTTRDFFHREESPTMELPAFDILDSKVLRFFCICNDSPDDTRAKNTGRRKFVLYYYLEDDTVQIEEPQVDNSGRPHGTLIKRHRIPKENDPETYIGPFDLRVGRDITIYGKTFRLTDCDKFTRDWYHVEKLDQPPAEGPPTEKPGLQYREEECHRIPMTYDKQYREVMLGGGFVNQDMQQFMEKDRMVCRFFAVYDDCLTTTFERRHMVILFYLRDDTVEIREQLAPNSSRPHFPVYFRRRHLPKAKIAPVGPCDPLLKKEDYFQISDFKVGEMMKLLDVNFFVYDADGFTRKYFREELKCELGPAIDVTVLVPHPPAAPVPSPTGYGTEADSMTSVKCIVPKQRIEQYKRSTELDGKCLRFLARLVEPLAPGQKERLFCIQYYLGDEEVMVTELSQRNVGVAGRKFLQRGKYLNDNEMHFKAENFVLGTTVRINKHPFHIIDADRFTKTYLETGHLDKASSDLYLVLERLRDSMKERLTSLRDVFRRIDQDKNGVITSDELKNCLLTVGYELSGEEEVTLLNHFDTSQNRQVNYVEFCDALLNLELALPFKYSRNRPPLSRPTDSGCDPAFAHREKTLQEADATRRAVREIQHLFYQQPRLVHRILKEFGHMSVGKTVSVEQVEHALRLIGHGYPSPTVQRCVAYLLPDVEFDSIDYIQLLQALSTTYNDLPADK